MSPQEQAIRRPEKKLDTDMTEGVIWRELVSFSIPLLFGFLFQQLYNTVDSIVVGNFVSSQALAAVGSTTNIINMLIGVFTGFSTGASVVIAQSYGAGDYRRVHEAVHTMILFIFILSAAFTVIGLLIVSPMLRLMDTPDDVFGEATTYLTIYFAGISGLMIFNTGSAILRAVGDSRRPLYFLIFSAILNTGMDLLFVISFHWGVAGVAWATIIAQFLTAFLVLYVLTRANGCYALHWHELRISKPILGRMLKIGLPTSIQMGLTSFSNIIVQSYINFFQSACMAGWACYIKIDQFLGLTMQAMGMAVTTFVGQNIGAGKHERARKGLRTTMFLLLICAAAEIAFVEAFATPLVQAFNDDPDVVRYGTLFVRMISPLYPLVCVANIQACALRGAGDANASMFILLGSYVVFRQCYLYIVSRVANTVVMIALGYPVGWLVAMISVSVYIRLHGLEGRKNEAKTAV